MSEEKLNNEELLAVEDSILNGLLGAYEDQKEDTVTIEIARKGKVFFSFDIRALTEKQYNDLQDKATKFKKAKNLGGVKVAEETDVTKFRSLLIYHATVEEDRKKLWNNKEAWNKLNVLNGPDLIDKVLKAGEKKAIIDKIDEISGYSDESDEIIKKLIRAGGKLTLLHEIFQRTGKLPDEIMNKPEGIRKFALLSMEVQLKRESEEQQALKRQARR